MLPTSGETIQPYWLNSLETVDQLFLHGSSTAISPFQLTQTDLMTEAELNSKRCVFKLIDEGKCSRTCISSVHTDSPHKMQQ
jgi:hypothetical protein